MLRQTAMCCAYIVLAMAAMPMAAPAGPDGQRKLEGIERIVLAETAAWPTIIPLADGSLGVVYQKTRRIKEFGGKNVAMEWIRSVDGGKSWSAPVIVAERRTSSGDLFAKRDGGGYVTYQQRNQALGQLPSGRIICAMTELDYPFDAAGKAIKMNYLGSTFNYTRMVYTWSDDLGQTWVKTRTLPAGPFGGVHTFKPLHGASPHWRIVTLADGTALMTLYGSYDPDYRGPVTAPAGTRVIAGVIRSTDNGETWGDISLIFSKPDVLPWEETALCLLEDDRLLAHMRTGRHNVVQFTSSDRGRTWQGPTDVTQSRQLPGGAFRLASGKLMATWGNRRKPFGAAAMLSFDNGKTWDYEHRVSLEWSFTNGSCGYANGAQAGDGSIVVVYYSSTTGKAHAVRFTEEQFVKASR
jgi:hypothetical protein